MTTGLATKDEWPQFTLGDLCSLITDGKHGDCEDQPHSGFYFLSVKDILGNRLVYENARQITEVDFSETNRRTNLQPGDVLFTNTGTIGRMAIAGDDPRTYRTTFQKSVAILKPRRDLIDPRFLYYLLHFDNANLSEFAAGTTQKNLLLKDIRSFEVKVPTLPEQRAIAHILGTLDDKIEVNRRMNRTLEEIARAIFQDWFVDFGPTRAKMEGLDPYLPPELWDLFPKELVDSELGEIPEAWEVKSLGEISKTVKGRSYRSSQLADSDTALVTLKSFGRGGGYQPEGLKSFTGDYKPEQVVNPGDVIVACTDVTQAGQVIGHPALVEPDSKYRCLVASLDAIIVRSTNDSVGREFLYFLCGTESFTNHTSAHSTGTTVLHLSKNAIPSYKMALPTPELLTQFRMVVTQFLELRLKNRLETNNLNEQRDALLPKLMSGKLETAHYS